MPSSFLSVDLGNSRCKLCLWTIPADLVPELSSAHELESRSGIGAAARTWVMSQARADSAAVSSVASPAIEDELCAALEACLSGRVLRSLDPGLTIECRDPRAVGRDRVFAARGAFELLRAPAIVVDAGTALTVDALRVEGTRAAFLGGAIAPGPELLADALARGTARLARIEPRPGVEALGRDTQAALQGGIAHGFRGAARELVERVSSEAGLGAVPVVLTGGARIFLTQPTAFGRRPVHEVPDLVHRGLIAAALSTHGRDGP
jgi:pantothenate kinase type III